MSQLTQCCPKTTTDELVDIREVTVDKDLPKEERIAAFLHQIKNPYRFRCGDFVVNAAFASNGVTLEECLQGILPFNDGSFKRDSSELRHLESDIRGSGGKVAVVVAAAVALVLLVALIPGRLS